MVAQLASFTEIHAEYKKIEQDVLQMSHREKHVLYKSFQIHFGLCVIYYHLVKSHLEMMQLFCLDNNK